jgi:hypothetical protein
VADPALATLVLFLYCWPSAATYLIDVTPLFQPFLAVLLLRISQPSHVGAEDTPVSTPGQYSQLTSHPPPNGASYAKTSQENRPSARTRTQQGSGEPLKGLGKMGRNRGML